MNSEWFVCQWLHKDLMSLYVYCFMNVWQGLVLFELPYVIYISNWLQNVNRVSTDIIYHKYFSSVLTLDAYFVRPVTV